MLSDFPDATKVLVVHEQPARSSQLAAWIGEWGYEPLPTAEPIDWVHQFSHLKKPWIGIFSSKIWEGSGIQIATLAMASPATVTAFTIVLAEPGSHRPLSAPGDILEEPFRPHELKARLALAGRVLALQHTRSLLRASLREARAQLRQLEGSLPICMDCKKIRDEQNRWQPIEHYISARTQAAFTHGLCPPCYRKRVQELCPAGE